MRYYIFLLLALFGFVRVSAQNDKQRHIDSLKTLLSTAKEDLDKLDLYQELLWIHQYYKEEEGLPYTTPALALAEKLNSKKGAAMVKYNTGRIYWHMGNFEMALKTHFEALQMAESMKDKELQARILTTIGQDYGDAGNYDQSLAYLNKALKIDESLGNRKELANIYNLMSWVYSNQGNFVEGINTTYASLKIAEEAGDKHLIAVLLMNIAQYHSELGNPAEALQYHQKAIKALMDVDDKINLGYSYKDMGKVYHTMGNNEAALKSYNEALKIAGEINDPTLSAAIHKDIGSIYQHQGNFKAALMNYENAAKEYEQFGNKQALSGMYPQMGTCYLKINQLADAKKYFDLAESLLQELNSAESFIAYYGNKHWYDSRTGHWESAYKNYMRYIDLRDSSFNKENMKKMLSTQLQYESEKEEAAAKAAQEKKDIRQRTIRNSIAAVLAGSLIFLVVVYRQRNKISKARKRSDELLLNILPGEVAEELKAKGSAEAKLINDVTVLFTDFKGFTELSEKVTPRELVKDLHECFSAFDRIMEQYGLEKIKTIGDAYMAAGGVPTPNERHATDVVRAALEIVQFIEAGKAEKIAANQPYFEVRIGVHTGPVVAGIVGVKKFSYDIWGDTVNTASRMESSGEAGKVNISGSTYELVKDEFHCIHRGKIPAKNKGEIDMYFVEGVAEQI